MTARFTVVPSPFEDRVGVGIRQGLHDAFALGERLRSEANETLNDEQLGAKASARMAKLAVLDGLPFILLCLLVAVFAVRELMIRIETRKIMTHHRSAGVAVLAPTNAREHDD